MAVVNAATINVRSGPGTEYPVTGSLVAGQSCSITGRNQASSWWKVTCTNGISGWVSGQVVTLSGPVNSVPVAQSAPPPTPTSFSGWKASYYNHPSLGGTPALVQDVPSINFNWGTGSPASSIRSEHFSAKFERTIDFRFGTYDLSVTFDDGIRLFIDDQIIIGAWNEGPLRTRNAQMVLSGSKRIRIEYFEATDNAQIQFSQRLIGASEAWRATYYGDTHFATQVLTRGEPRSGTRQLDYNWGHGTPAPGVPADQFSARWVGSFHFEGGDYRFHATSDDGVRVYIDGILLINHWQNGYVADLKNTFTRIGSGKHEIIVEYYESYGDALIQVWWERINAGSTDPGRGRAE
jgi:hypothetical protein